MKLNVRKLRRGNADYGFSLKEMRIRTRIFRGRIMAISPKIMILPKHVHLLLKVWSGLGGYGNA
jgi:hypothetical protein